MGQTPTVDPVARRGSGVTSVKAKAQRHVSSIERGVTRETEGRILKEIVVTVLGPKLGSEVVAAPYQSTSQASEKAHVIREVGERSRLCVIRIRIPANSSRKNPKTSGRAKKIECQPLARGA